MRWLISGFANDYQAKVKTQHQKNLEETIQSAIIFDNTINKQGIDKLTKFNNLKSNLDKQ